MYTWWVFLHIVGVFGFLTSHGVSVAVTFQLRTERDPEKIAHLLALSGSSVKGLYASLGMLLLGGTVAGFLGDWWSQAWIWTSLALLVATSVAMIGLARPYYRRVGLVARAKASGSEAVTDEQLDRLLRSGRPVAVAGIGFGALLVILYLMMFKPSLGFSTGPGPLEPPPGGVAITALSPLRFDSATLTGPASEPFQILFDNREPGIPHNVAIYTDESATEALFVGDVITGTDTITYQVEPLEAGSYFFRCDLHPTQMVGTLSVE